MSETYQTTYCSRAHRLLDGVPVGHECHILPPSALREEKSGNHRGAMAIIQGSSLDWHRGVPEAKEPRKGK